MTKRTQPLSGYNAVYGGLDHTIDIGDITELEDFLRIDRDQNECFDLVEWTLRTYPDMKRAVDHGPRPAHKLAVIEPLLEHARQLSAGLRSSDFLSHVGFDLMFQRFPIEKERRLLAELDDFVSAAETVTTDLRAQPSRHGQTSDAKRIVAEELTHIADYFVDTAFDAPRGEFVVHAMALGGLCERPAGSPNRSNSRWFRYSERQQWCIDCHTTDHGCDHMQYWRRNHRLAA